jgi:PBP1b-binding outer membrane lipoprotein LpoB
MAIMRTRAGVPRVAAAAIVVLCLGLVAGCATKVENVDPSTEGYLSGRWNDSDARAVAEELVPDCLDRAWLPEFRGEHGDTRPRVLVGDIENKTSEHLDTDVFMNEIQRVLINSGNVRFVADAAVRDALMDEVRWQKEMARGEGVAPDVERGVSGADFMMMGSVSSVVDQVEGDAIVYYQADLWLIDLRDWEKVWIGSAKRKHLVEHSKVRF